MKHLEDFIAKDKLTVSDEMFERICAGVKKESNLQARLQQENEEFKAFAKENYFDILSDYYPQFLIEKE